MHYKGQKTRQVVSSFGETPIARGYYCSVCTERFSPWMTAWG